MTIDSILCPLDFSEASQSALCWAAAFALKYESSLTVVNAVDPLLAQAASMRYGLDLSRTETEPALREFVMDTLPAAARPVNLAMEVRVGDAPTVILEAADRHKVDLMVLGTHGLGGFQKLVLGSTTERVLRQAQVPVLAVPSGDAAVTLDATGARCDITSILAATDFSEAANEAVMMAAALAPQFNASLTITHVVSPVVVPIRWQPYVSAADEGRVAEARERLEAWLRESAIDGEVVVATGRPAESIGATAAEKNADLIVMGLWGDRSALVPRPGSIAYRILSDARVPVMVVPPKQ